ncbi:MAG: radical SAM protein [Candidatus Margulisbacteria bacterium]|nr:radical SAM protein [Candidatus Margulisiibacteriota bacterium]
MSLIEPVIRPPSEANSFLLQVTLGCSQNTCAFCGAYQDKPFKFKNIQEIEKDIDYGSKLYPETKRVFLCDGDALVLSNSKLIPILEKLNATFPNLGRISSYANAQNILNKSESELKELYDNKLKLIFIGLESGHDQILKKMNKKANAQEMIDAVLKAKAAGIKSHIIVLLGLGQSQDSFEHAKVSAQVVNQMNPRYISLLSLMLIPGTKLFNDYQEGKFKKLTPQELLQETYWFLEDLTVQNTIFRCNHASNYIPLEGRLPQNKDNLLKTIQAGIAGTIGLKPEIFRGL